MSSHLNNKKILITGVTGYLGSHLASLLLKTHPSISIVGTTRSLKNEKRLSQFKHAL